MEVVYEDNHIIIVSKRSGEIVQGDKTGDTPLSETVKEYIKTKYQKPGNVFLGVVHRLDRPVWGLVVFARTSKALTRLNKMFAEGEVHKTYWAVTGKPTPGPILRLAKRLRRLPEQGSPTRSLSQKGGENRELEHWLVRNEKQNKSYAYDHEVPNSKHALLRYRVLAEGENYDLVEVQLMTGRHHQIRCQLATIGRTIKGDLKYGARRSNPDGSISLLARSIEFVHPVTKEVIRAEAALPDELFKKLAKRQL